MAKKPAKLTESEQKAKLNEALKGLKKSMQEGGSDNLRGANKYGKKGQMGQIMKKDPEGEGME